VNKAVDKNLKQYAKRMGTAYTAAPILRISVLNGSIPSQVRVNRLTPFRSGEGSSSFF